MNQIFSFFIFFLISCGIHVFLFICVYSVYFSVERHDTVNKCMRNRLVIEYQYLEIKCEEFPKKQENVPSIEKLRERQTDKKIKFRNNSSFQRSDNAQAFSDKKVYFEKNSMKKKGDGVFYSSNTPISRVSPIYPSRAKLLKIEGKVIVIYNINIDGKVKNVRILYSIPPRVFDDNVRLAMLHWVYRKGKPENDLIVTFKFNLRGIEELRK